jgi:hypothetical protein
MEWKANSTLRLSKRVPRPRQVMHEDSRLCPIHRGFIPMSGLPFPISSEPKFNFLSTTEWPTTRPRTVLRLAQTECKR